MDGYFMSHGTQERTEIINNPVMTHEKGTPLIEFDKSVNDHHIYRSEKHGVHIVEEVLTVGIETPSLDQNQVSHKVEVGNDHHLFDT